MSAADAEDGTSNQVYLRGRLAAEPVMRDLPSGDILAIFRLTVDRPPGDRVRVEHRVHQRRCPRAALTRTRGAGRADRGDRQLAPAVLALAGRPGEPLHRRGSEREGQPGWSARRRITKPEAGFGVNNVDLRGIRAPAAATAATAATGVGRIRIAKPWLASAARNASFVSWA